MIRDKQIENWKEKGRGKSKKKEKGKGKKVKGGERGMGGEEEIEKPSWISKNSYERVMLGRMEG